MLQPSNTWQWQYHSIDDRLVLDIDETMAFSTVYRRRSLTADVEHSSAFSIEDAGYYQFICSQIELMEDYSKAEAVQIALNATAVQRFFKPLMPKSWFFKTNQSGEFGIPLSPGVDVLLYTDQGYGRFLLIECGPTAALCMLLDPELALDERKTMQQFEIIKVMNDRLFKPLEVQQLKYA